MQKILVNFNQDIYIYFPKTKTLLATYEYMN